MQTLAVKALQTPLPSAFDAVPWALLLTLQLSCLSLFSPSPKDYFDSDLISLCLKWHLHALKEAFLLSSLTASEASSQTRHLYVTFLPILLKPHVSWSCLAFSVVFVMRRTYVVLPALPLSGVSPIGINIPCWQSSCLLLRCFPHIHSSTWQGEHDWCMKWGTDQ